MGKFYRDYADFLAERFRCKMQKLTVDAGFTCPNRDGAKGIGGCIYCNNRTFSPDLQVGERRLSVADQIERGRSFFARKYPQMRYLAYFQSYTNTYGDIEPLLALYREALGAEGVDGLVIATRPDCVSAELLEALAEINRSGRRVIMEYGAETSHEQTLRLINRCHTWAETEAAVAMTRDAGLDVGLHLIMGLPGESRSMMMQTIDAVNRLRPATVKFHQLQVVRGTRLAAMYERGEVDLKIFTVDEYLDLCCEIIGRLDPSIAIERFTSQSPDAMLIAPRWGLKNHEFTDRLNMLLAKRQSAKSDAGAHG